MGNCSSNDTPAAAPGSPLTTTEYAALYNRREATPRPFGNICGRFIRGVKAEDFDILSEEPGKKLSWVCGPGILRRVLGLSPADSMAFIGFDPAWLEKRVADGTKFKLVLFNSDEAAMATWDNLFALIRLAYGAELSDKLKPFEAELKATPYDAIDPQHRLRDISTLPVAEKVEHAEFVSAERFMARDPPSLYDARGLLYHAVGCNFLFLGTGQNADGVEEYLVLNRRISDLPGAVVVDLHVTQGDVELLKAKAKDLSKANGS